MFENPQPPVVRSCAALSVGDHIEAWCGGRLLDAGTVIRPLPSVGMAWIVCARTGAHKLVDMQGATVVRLAAAPQPAWDSHDRSPGAAGCHSTRAVIARGRCF